MIVPIGWRFWPHAMLFILAKEDVAEEAGAWVMVGLKEVVVVSVVLGSHGAQTMAPTGI